MVLQIEHTLSRTIQPTSVSSGARFAPGHYKTNSMHNGSLDIARLGWVTLRDVCCLTCITSTCARRHAMACPHEVLQVRGLYRKCETHLVRRPLKWLKTAPSKPQRMPMRANTNISATLYLEGRKLCQCCFVTTKEPSGFGVATAKVLKIILLTVKHSHRKCKNHSAFSIVL